MWTSSELEFYAYPDVFCSEDLLEVKCVKQLIGFKEHLCGYVGIFGNILHSIVVGIDKSLN